MCTLLLRLDVFIEIGRTMRGLRVGRETTITAVHISAVHHASAVLLGRSERGMFDAIGKQPRTQRRRRKQTGKPTARCVVDGVISGSVYDETGEADSDCD
jgi:hypothetical protein